MNNLIKRQKVLKNKNDIYLYKYLNFYEVTKNNNNVGITLLLTDNKHEAISYFETIAY